MNNSERAANIWAGHMTLVTSKNLKDAFIKEFVKEYPDGDDWYQYSDYDPDDRFLDVIQKSGIHCTGNFFSGLHLGFPIKTGVKQEKGILYVKFGYGSDWRRV